MKKAIKHLKESKTIFEGKQKYLKENKQKKKMFEGKQ